MASPRITRPLTGKIPSISRAALGGTARTRGTIGVVQNRPIFTPGVAKVEIAGSYRRARETVGDLDILVTARRGSPVVERFVGYDEVVRVLERGETLGNVVLDI